MIFDFFQCHVGYNSSQKVGGSNAYPDPASEKVGGSGPRKTHRIYAAGGCRHEVLQTCVGRLVDGFVELDEREQVVVTYGDDAVAMETVRDVTGDVTGLRGDAEVSRGHRAVD